MWEVIKEYYISIGEEYQVNPIVFVGIHVIATPLFIAAVAWIVRNYKKGKSIVMPSVVACLIFNAANIYLVISGKNIPVWIYVIIGTTTIISGYFSVKKIQHKIHSDK